MAEAITAAAPYRVKFSIRLKLLLLVTLLLAGSLLFYLVMALKLYEADKSAYIFETSLSTVNSLASQVENQFEIIHLEARNALTGSKRSKKDVSFRFPEASKIVQTRLFDKGRPTKSLKNSALIAELSLTTLTPLAHVELGRNRTAFNPVDSGTEVGLIDLNIKSRLYHDGQIAIRFLAEAITQVFRNENAFQTYLVSESGQVLAEGNEQSEDNSAFTTDQGLLNIFTRGTPEGVIEVEWLGQGKVLSAFTKLEGYPFYIFATIPHAKAFAIVDELARKSTFGGIAVLSFAIFLGVLVARGFTRPIEVLVAATRRITSGDFGHQIQIKSSDELGQLSQSFNAMSGKIIDLMEQEKEKNRMERELEVATQVQSSFFPPPLVTTDNLEIASYFKPSTECGGDWWGYFPQNDRTIILLGDATGHGVPSALVTATASSVFSAVGLLVSQGDLDIKNPTALFNVLNHAILNSANRAVMMTFFAAIIDHKDSKLTYSSASHNPSLILSRKTGKTRPLVNGRGHILGDSPTPEFSSEQVDFFPGDILIAYTDGIVEAENAKGRQYGLRKLTKIIEAHANKSTAEIKQAMIDDVVNYSGTDHFDDDVTFIIAKAV